MYEPNQYVMNCGIVDPTAGPIRFSSPISRNLNNGDAIVLLVRHTLGGNMDMAALVATLSPSSDLHITPQIYISYEICGARRCSIP